MYQDSLNADVVVLGSSRAWTQYNPTILDSMLNTNVFINGIDGSAIYRNRAESSGLSMIDLLKLNNAKCRQLC